LNSSAPGEPWWKIVTQVAASLAALISAIAALYGLIQPARQYLMARASELKWKRFETTRKMWTEFTSDPEMQEGTRRVEAHSDDLVQLFDMSDPDLTSEGYRDRNRVDRYFEFLESLVYAIGAGTLTRDDIAVFGWLSVINIGPRR
jgi:hypothetical protein